MKPIFLHGAPADRMLTVARALLLSVPGRLFDNHAAIDVASTAFDFRAPGFCGLAQTVRAAVPRSNCLMLDSEIGSAGAPAGEIIRAAASRACSPQSSTIGVFNICQLPGP